MVEDETYNPATDNVEKKEAPRLNPAVGISNFARASPSMPPEKDWRKNIYREAVQFRKQEIAASKPAEKPKKKPFLSKIGYIRYTHSKESRMLREQINLLRLRNQVEAIRNEIKQMKFAQQIKKQRAIQKLITVPIALPKPLIYPAFSSPETNADIDSAFFADINHSDKSLWGGENYYDEQFYNENFFGTEFDSTPEYHLQIKPSREISPLLW